MLSKCANPDCSAVFRYLHQGKLFCLSPIPDLENRGLERPEFNERFWLCDQCSQRMTVMWDGRRAKLVSIGEKFRTGAAASKTNAAEDRCDNPESDVDSEKRMASSTGEASMSAIASRTPTASSTIFRRILVATDFSESSRRAFCDAKLLAEQTGAQLSVVHVLLPDWKYETFASPPDLDTGRMAAEERLENFVAKADVEKKVETTVIRHGPVSAVVASLIAKTEVDLLVIGSRGLGGWRKLALGSVAEELMRTVPCPVMTIGPQADIAAVSHGPGFHVILFATDFGAGATRALPLALALAQSERAKLVLLHMIAPLPPAVGSLIAYGPATGSADEVFEWEHSSRQRALHHLHQCLPREPGLAQKPEFVVGTDFLPEGILTAAGKFKADLIVMGAKRAVSARAAAHLPWAAVHEVVRRAPCAVLTVAP